MRLKRAFLVGIISICLGKVAAIVSVTSMSPDAWGSDGDAELEISVNVTSDSGWENVAVTVDTPFESVANAKTTDTNPSAEWRVYFYTITSLYIDDAGTYTFTATDDSATQFDESTVEVHIFTVAVLSPESQFFAVERTNELIISTYVRTDGLWDNVEVKLTSPSGQDVATTNQSAASLGPIWRFYTSTVTDIMPGVHTFTVQETLSGRSKMVEVAATVEVNLNTDADEYLFRFQSEASTISTLIPDFYSYFYDGPDSTYILDGGNDMYDRGNYLTVSTSEGETLMASYGKPYGFQSYHFSSIPAYPFTSLMWISNAGGLQNRFEYQVASQTGIGEGQSLQTPPQNFSVASYDVTYATVQAIDLTTDPSICEVFFFLTNPNWLSVNPENVTFDVSGSPPTSLENHFAILGPVQNVMMGYTLLSRTGGVAVADSDIQAVLSRMVEIISEKDAVAISSADTALVQNDENSIVLTSRIVLTNWTGSTVTLLTPGRGTITITDFTVEGGARIYSYTLTNPTIADAGVYTFRVTDGYGYQLDSLTELTVYTAIVEATDSEYWGANGDAELIITVQVTADDWTDLTVMVTLPDGIAKEATTTDTSGATRTYTYTITNLFVEDAGLYKFYASAAGFITSDQLNVTVYLFTIDTYPDSFHSHIAGREDRAVIMIYGVCDGDWANVQGQVISPTGQVFAMMASDGPTPRIKEFTANVTGAMAGSYNISLTETLQTKTYSRLAIHEIEYHNGTIVDDYLYRIMADSDKLVRYITDWHTYLYDGPDHTSITDGGMDMYNGGNVISLYWDTQSASQEVLRQPYGKPFDNGILTYSSVSLYPFVSMMWISNTAVAPEENFSLKVQGTSGGNTANYQTMRRTLIEGTYTVTYETFQVLRNRGPTICEVYFTISNLPNWNSIESTSFNVSIGRTPPEFLENTATVYGYPQNIMMGYTLLSSTTGAEISYLEVDLVLENFVSRIAEKDEFSVMPVAAGGVDSAMNGDNATVEILVETNGQWDNVTVRVVSPAGVEEELTTYRYTNINTQRIYEYSLIEVSYQDDDGQYQVIATDAFGDEMRSTFILKIYTATIAANETELWGAKEDPELTMNVRVTAQNWTDLAVMITLPDGSAQEATTMDTGDGERTYSYVVTNLFIEDAGDYGFYTSTGGLVTSAVLNITVYVFTVDTYPESFESHIAGQQDVAVIMIYAVYNGDWANIQGEVNSPTGQTFPMEPSDGSTPSIKAFVANVTGAMEGDYRILLTETLQAKTYTLTRIHHIVRHAGTVVDDYLYRIMTDSNKLVSYIPNWYTYWYDGTDHTNIADGGMDMYNGGNAISFYWGTQLTSNEIRLQPYGEPYDNGVITFSSTSLYPFVSMMWISNNALVPQDWFSIEVAGTAGGNTVGYSERRRILVEGTYHVTYDVFQVLRSTGPTICEVYFLISNPDYWGSVEPQTFNVTIGNTPPDFLQNTATAYGSPKNVMIGYTLLSSSTGGRISYVDIDLVIENFVSRIAQKDQFAIMPVTEDAVTTAIQGGDATVETLIESDGQWDNVTVRVVTPSGAEDAVTNYRSTNVTTQRIYEYVITDVSYGTDNGDYQFFATDSFGYEIQSNATLYVFTTTISATPNEYVSEPGGEVTMLVEVTSEDLPLSVEVDTPTQGTKNVTCSALDGNPNAQTCTYTVSDITFEKDQGEYIFRVTERVSNNYDYNATATATLQVFTATISATPNQYVSEPGGEVTMSVEVTSENLPLSVEVDTPTQGTKSVTCSALGGNPNAQTCTYTVSDITFEKDQGEYIFRVTEGVSNNYDYSATATATLQVFSIAIESEEDSYTVSEGEVLEISAVVSAKGSFGEVSVSIQTPGGRSTALEDYVIVDGNRRYTYTSRDVSMNDAGEYVFSATQAFLGDSYTVSTNAVTVIVKEPPSELSGGEIAGIVIGSIAGALILAGFGYWLVSRNSENRVRRSSSLSSIDEKGEYNKASELDEKKDSKDQVEAVTDSSDSTAL